LSITTRTATPDANSQTFQKSSSRSITLPANTPMTLATQTSARTSKGALWNSPKDT